MAAYITQIKSYIAQNTAYITQFPKHLIPNPTYTTQHLHITTQYAIPTTHYALRTTQHPHATIQNTQTSTPKNNFFTQKHAAMTQRQENTLTMWVATGKILDNNQTIWNTTPGFASNVTKFIAKLQLIQPELAIQQGKTKGVTLDKKALRTIATTQAVQISSNLQALAKDKSNNTLFKDMNYPKSTLDAIPDTEIYVVFKHIHDTALANIPDISNYGTSAAELAQFLASANDYAGAIPLPRTKTVAKKTATKNLATIIKEGNTILQTLDKLIGNFNNDHPNFVSDYRTARIIIDLKGRPDTKPPPPPAP